MKSFAKYCSCLLVTLTTLTLVSFVQGTDFSSTPHRHNETAGGRCDDPIDDVCGDLFVTDLIAGQQYDAGDIFVWQTSEDSPLYIRYQTTGNWLISETHLAVEMTLAEIPGSNGNPPPGQFEFGDEHNPLVSEVTYEVDISGFDVACAADLFIAAHAVVETSGGDCSDDRDGDDCGQEETGWGNGEDFPGANWAMYIVFNQSCCEDVTYDFGDAIDGFGAYYQTLLANDGAYHQIVDGVYLGLGVDAETDGQPTGLADGDDNDGNDDEDGVIFLTPLNSHPTFTTEACVDVTASVDGFLNVWIDYNYIASWMDPSYHIFDDEPVTMGSNLLCWQIPAGLYDGDTFMRFRFTSDDPDGNLSYSGFWPNGEVEDYQVGIGTTLDNDDFTTPDEFIVSAPYPNPFNPALTVEYVVPNREFMTIRIFNVRGQEVASLYDGMIESGRHAITWNADSQPGGAYLLRIQYGTHSETHKVLLTK